jgi:hypothetical protein
MFNRLYTTIIIRSIIVVYYLMGDNSLVLMPVLRLAHLQRLHKYNVFYCCPLSYSLKSETDIYFSIIAQNNVSIGKKRIGGVMISVFAFGVLVRSNQRQ